MSSVKNLKLSFLTTVLLATPGCSASPDAGGISPDTHPPDLMTVDSLKNKIANESVTQMLFRIDDAYESKRYSSAILQSAMLYNRMINSDLKNKVVIEDQALARADKALDAMTAVHSGNEVTEIMLATQEFAYSKQEAVALKAIQRLLSSSVKLSDSQKEHLKLVKSVFKGSEKLGTEIDDFCKK